MTSTVFSKNLRARRSEAGFRSARDFAEAIGINENRYSRYERGTSEPNLEVICRIARILHLTPNDLLGFEQFQADNEAADSSFSQAAGNNTEMHSAASTSAARPSGWPSPAPELIDALSWRFAEAYVRLRAGKPHPRRGNARDAEAERLPKVAKLFSLIRNEGLSAIARLLTSADFASAAKSDRACVQQVADALLVQLLDVRSESNSRTPRRG